MNCTRARDKLPLLLYGDLDEQEAVAVQIHLVQCEACRVERTELARIRRLLDTKPAASIDVDLQRLYREAAEVHPRRPRSRRRAVLVAVGTAAVVLVAFAMNLEFRLDADQLIVRWGNPPSAADHPGQHHTADKSPGPAMKVEQPELVQVHSEHAAMEDQVELLTQLVRALAADSETRDQRYGNSIASLERQLDELELAWQRRWLSAERSDAALYAAIFRPRETGEIP